MAAASSWLRPPPRPMAACASTSATAASASPRISSATFSAKFTSTAGPNYPRLPLTRGTDRHGGDHGAGRRVAGAGPGLPDRGRHPAGPAPGGADEWAAPAAQADRADDFAHNDVPDVEARRGEPKH